MRDKAGSFLDWSRAQQLECLLESAEQAQEFLPEVEALRAQLGSVMQTQFDFATCAWGCKGGGHLIEAITGKCVSTARATLLLIDTGHYDEAMALVRSLAEVANLFLLFSQNPEDRRRWVNSDRRARNRDFAPVKVRLRLEELGLEIPFDEAHYRELSEVGAHANPDLRPQSHNEDKVQTLGGMFQERGYIRCVLELAETIGMVGAWAPFLTLVDEDKRTLVSHTSLSLFDASRECGDKVSLESYKDRTDAMTRLRRTLSRRGSE